MEQGNFAEVQGDGLLPPTSKWALCGKRGATLRISAHVSA